MYMYMHTCMHEKYMHVNKSTLAGQATGLLESVSVGSTRLAQTNWSSIYTAETEEQSVRVSHSLCPVLSPSKYSIRTWRGHKGVEEGV